jgi:hypothetical protein
VDAQAQIQSEVNNNRRNMAQPYDLVANSATPQIELTLPEWHAAIDQPCVH